MAILLSGFPVLCLGVDYCFVVVGLLQSIGLETLPNMEIFQPGAISSKLHFLAHYPTWSPFLDLDGRTVSSGCSLTSF